MEKKEQFNCQGTLEVITNDDNEESYKITAIIGDRFMNGGFFPAKELKRVYKQWENTLHDINHFGTNYPAGFFSTSNILFFVGHHKNVKYNSATKEVTMDIEINPDAMYANAWKAYIKTCKMAGLIPNVSVTYLGKQEFVLAKNLPTEANWKAEGYTKDDLVPVLMEVEPICVSTVLQGRCDDKDGCGMNDSCSLDSCKDKKEQDVAVALEQERQEIIKRIKSKEEKLDD